NDVDDRVQRANLVQVHALDGHLVDGRLRLRKPLEQGLCARPPCLAQRRPVDVGEDFRKAAVGMVRSYRWGRWGRWERYGRWGRCVPMIVAVMVRVTMSRRRGAFHRRGCAML